MDTGILGMGEFTNLNIWKKAHELTLKIYMLTDKLPKSEIYGLTNQLRRAAVSVESNIAEGEDRYTITDKNKFLIDSRSSCSEVRTQLMIVADLHKGLSKEAWELIAEYKILAKQINSLISYRRKNYAQKN